MVEAIVRPAGRYMLSLSARHAGDATRTFRDGIFTATLEVDGGLERAFARQFPDGRLHVVAGSEDGLRAAALLPRRRRRSLRVPPALPRRRAARSVDEPARRAAARARRHRRPRAAAGTLRPADHLERSACRSSGAIVRAATPALDRFHAPPSAQALGALSPAELRRLGLHARRGAALVRLCRSLDLERLTRRADLRTSRLGCAASAASARGRSESSRWKGSAAGITDSSATSAS